MQHPLLLTQRLNLGLDGRGHYDPKQEPTMISHCLLLSRKAPRTTLRATVV
jgi:hypothetical protein